MNVHSPKPWDTKHDVTQYFWLTVDLFLVLDFFGVCMIEKNYPFIYLYTQTSQTNCFRRVHKILRWIGSI